MFRKCESCVDEGTKRRWNGVLNISGIRDCGCRGLAHGALASFSSNGGFCTW